MIAQNCAYQRTHRVFFPSDEATLSEVQTAALDSVALFLKSHPYCSIEVFARADSVGSVAYNLDLSARRADVVVNYLKTSGLQMQGLKMEFRGEAKDSSSGADLQFDRRAEIRIYFPIDPEEMEGYMFVFGSVKDGSSNAGVLASIRHSADSISFLSDTPSGTYSMLVPRSYRFSIEAEKASGAKTSKEFLLPGYRNIDSLEVNLIFNQSSASFQGKEIKEGTKISFENINFYPNKAELMPGAEIAIYDLYDFLAAHPTMVVEIGGHINLPNVPPDLIGSSMKELSWNRAKVVTETLIEMGIEPSRLTYKGYGNSKMIYPNPVSAGQKLANRRVEVTILRK